MFSMKCLRQSRRSSAEGVRERCRLSRIARRGVPRHFDPAVTNPTGPLPFSPPVRTVALDKIFYQQARLRCQFSLGPAARVRLPGA